MTVLPNTFVIGAAKAGTTSLCRLLGHHPEIYFSTLKEPQYFSFPQCFERGLEWYKSHFAGATDEPIVAEGSTSYSWIGLYPETVNRMLDVCPEPRIIYAVREPFARLESLWIQARHIGYGARADFSESLRHDPVMIESALYKKQIDAYRQRVSDDRIHIMYFEEFAADPLRELQRCFAFLGIDQTFEPPDVATASNTWKDKRNDRPLMDLLRSVPGYNGIRDRLVPHRLRQWMKPAMTRPMDDRPEWDRETSQWVMDQIGDDVRQFLEHYGKPADFWNLDVESDSAPHAKSR